MANTELKRYNGTGWDPLYPKTTTGQVTGLSTVLADYIPKSWRGNTDHTKVATLDSNDKVPFAQLPSTAITGMDFKSAITTQTEFDTNMEPPASMSEGSEEEAELNGSYVIVSGDVTGDLSLDVTAYSQPEARFKNFDGSLSTTISVQAGDWIVATGHEDDGTGTMVYVYAIIDNNQKDRFLAKSGGTMSGNVAMGGYDITGATVVAANSFTLRTQGTDASVYYGDQGDDLLFKDALGNVHSVLHNGDMGAGSLIDADKLDGQEGSYYRNASNINAGTISDTHLPASISSDITGNAATATKLATARTITIDGDVTAVSNTFDGTANKTFTLSVSDDSHEHTGTTVKSDAGAGHFLSWSQYKDLDGILAVIDNSLQTRAKTTMDSVAPTDPLEGDIWFDTSA